MATRAEPGEWEQYSNSIILRRYLQKNGPNFIAAIQTADAGELSALLPMVARMISLPPVWLENFRAEAAKAFEMRLTTSAFFCQHVQFLLSCGFIPTPFFETKLSSDAANFFQDIADQKGVEEGTIVEVNSDHPVFHPFVQTEIKKVQVKAVLASKTKPLLLNLYSGGKSGVPPLPTNIIFKAGDDLRQDMSCLQAFRLFNFFWRQRNLLYRRHPVQVHVYGCVPMASDKKNCMGCVEFVPGCVPISKLEELNSEKRIEGKILDRLIASAAGSYIACYILGIRDRHYENILVQKDTGLLFHIDYGKVLGDKVTIDTSSIAITPDFYEVLGDAHYEQFVQVAASAFMVLRHYRETLHFFIYRLFSSFSTEVKVREFLVSALFLDLDDLAAQERMKSKIMKAPASFKTRVKNAVHKVAVGIKKSGSSGRLSVGSPTNRKSTQTLSMRKESGVELLEGKKE